MNLFSDEVRRNPYQVYDQLRVTSPVLRVPPPFNGWMVFDYETVKWVLNDPQTFSSQVAAPKNWFIFYDPPAHSKLRALISRAFTPRVISDLEPRIRQSPPACWTHSRIAAKWILRSNMRFRCPCR